MFGIRPEGPPRKGWRRLDPRPTLFGIVLITLVVLKLTAVINWSWWWVLSPMWISGIFTGLTLGGLLVLLWLGKRKDMRMSADEWREAREMFVARNANHDASGGDLGLQDGGGEAASPPDG